MVTYGHESVEIEEPEATRVGQSRLGSVRVYVLQSPHALAPLPLRFDKGPFLSQSNPRRLRFPESPSG